MPSTMTLSDILKKIPEPGETAQDRERRYQAEHAELNRALSKYNKAKVALEQQRTDEVKAQAAAEQIGNIDLSNEQIGARLSALKRFEKTRAEHEGAERLAEDTLKNQAIHFHGSLWGSHHAEEQRVTGIISEDVRVAARWGDDGSGFLLNHILKLSAPMKALNKLYPPTLPQPHEQRNGDWWAGFAADLIGKFSRLMECKEKFGIWDH
jgi:hypothetical protein